MRFRRHLATLAALFTATAGGCVFPTEHDAAVHVSVDPLPILIRGDDTYATARAWQRLATGDSSEIANVSFVWSSDNPLIATVDANGHVVGIKSGTAIIRAAAANFDKRAAAGEIALRVSNTLEIDSIRPDSVKYGEIVTVYGVGLLDTLGVFFQIGTADLIQVPFTAALAPNGTSRISYWVPPPAHSARLFYIGAGVFGFSTDTVRVVRRDIYEPNETSPTLINLETSRPFPGTFLNFFLFLNPALAFEELPRGVTSGADWYRFQQSTTRDLTIVLSAPEVKGTFLTYLSDSLGYNGTKYFIGSKAWTLGPGAHDCRGKAFSPDERAGDSTIVALAGVPPGTLDAIASYGQEGRYSLFVIEGYVTSNKLDPRIVKDAHEEDDYCDAAGAQVLETLPFRDTLTIDNPHDVDWIKFHVPTQQLVRIRTAVLPAVAGQDSSDIDVYLLHDNGPGMAPDSLGGIAKAGSTNDSTFGLVLGLPAGDYYAVVVDFAGVPTPYVICISTPTDPKCQNPFPGGPAAASAPLPAVARRRLAFDRARWAAVQQAAPASRRSLFRGPF